MIEQLARVEGWTDDEFDIIVAFVEQQPRSTLRADLAHFTDRLKKAKP